MATQTEDRQYRVEEYIVDTEPFYISLTDEVEIFEAAYRQRVPMLLKGPTGTGKTRFVEYMAWKLGQPLTVVKKKSNKTAATQASPNGGLPLVTVACHEDMTASDLVGRYLLDAKGTRWIDGPLTRAVKVGGICYLDEIVEARKDTTVIIHPLADHRRILTIDKLGEVVEAADGFLLVVSYNPGYQNALKDLKHSTRQRFVALEFVFPDPEREAMIIAHESGSGYRNCRHVGQTRRQDQEFEGARPRRSGVHARAHLCRPAYSGRSSGEASLPGVGHLGDN